MNGLQAFADRYLEIVSPPDYPVGKAGRTDLQHLQEKVSEGMAYFANSTHGDVLDAQCDMCPLGESLPLCPVKSCSCGSIMYNWMTAGLKEAMSLLVSELGQCMVGVKLIETTTITTRPGQPSRACKER